MQLLGSDRKSHLIDAISRVNKLLVALTSQSASQHCHKKSRGSFEAALLCCCWCCCHVWQTEFIQGMMERCREMMGLLQPAWLSTAVLQPQCSGWWCSKVYNNYPSIWVSGGTATWQGTEIFLFQQGLRCLVVTSGTIFLFIYLFIYFWDRNAPETAGTWSVMFREVTHRAGANCSQQFTFQLNYY